MTNKKNKKPQKVSKNGKFIPKPEMVKWLNTSIELQTNTITEISEACDINRKQWYRWIDTPGFEDWYYEEYEKKLKRLRPNVDRIGWKYAEEGSFNHLELMAKRTGAVRDDKVGVAQQINVQGNISDIEFIKDEDK